jgi:hypothetical protein
MMIPGASLESAVVAAPREVYVGIVTDNGGKC